MLILSLFLRGVPQLYFTLPMLYSLETQLYLYCITLQLALLPLLWGAAALIFSLLGTTLLPPPIPALLSCIFLLRAYLYISSCLSVSGS